MKINRRQFLQALGITPVIPAVNALPVPEPEPMKDPIYYGECGVVPIRVDTLQSDCNIAFTVRELYLDVLENKYATRETDFGPWKVTPRDTIAEGPATLYAPVTEKSAVIVTLEDPRNRLTMHVTPIYRNDRFQPITIGWPMQWVHNP